MTRAALPVLAILALTVSACATARPALPVPESAAAPAPVEGYDWFYQQDGDEARLAYGLEQSDDLRLGLDCRRGSGRLEISAEATAAARELRLESGGETLRLPARAEPSEVSDGVLLNAAAPAAAPVFQGFRRTHWLAVWDGDARQAYAPHAVSVPNIERFFAFCG